MGRRFAVNHSGPHRLLRERPLAGVRGGSDEHHPADEFQMPRRRLRHDLGARRVADEQGLVESLGHEQLREEFARLRHAERPGRLGRAAEAREVEREHGTGRLDHLSHGVPVLVGHAQTVREHVVGAVGDAGLADEHRVFPAAEYAGGRHPGSLGARQDDAQRLERPDVSSSGELVDWTVLGRRAGVDLLAAVVGRRLRHGRAVSR